MANDFIIKDSNGKDRVYKGVEYVTLTTTSGNRITFREPVDGDLRTYGTYWVKAFDHYGNVIKQEKLNSGDVFTLPTAPALSNLEFKKWVSMATITEGSVTVDKKDIYIYPVYVGIGGSNEFEVELTEKTGLSLVLKMDGTKDWGDGTIDATTSHTYSDYGKYTVICSGTTLTATNSVGVFGQTSSANNYTVVSARLSSVNDIPAYAFRYCSSLKSVIFPEGECILNNYSFSDCYMLKSITIPENTKISSGANYVFSNCYALKTAIVLGGINYNNAYTFSNCYSLKEVFLSDLNDSLAGQVFQYCYAIENVKLPSIIKSLSTSVFYACRNILSYDFTKCESIPTLGGTNTFSNINHLCKIYVPDDLYDTWITATNWTTYANQIYKASEMEEEQ